METTGYCACSICTSWRRDLLGRPIFTSGSQRGQRKTVGQTASGTRARPGTIAADTRLFPFGTIVYIPGYGYGRVEDRGGAIKGRRLDLFFKRHEDAVRWGRVTKQVRIWRPETGAR